MVGRLREHQDRSIPLNLVTKDDETFFDRGPDGAPHIIFSKSAWVRRHRILSLPANWRWLDCSGLFGRLSEMIARPIGPRDSQQKRIIKSFRDCGDKNRITAQLSQRFFDPNG
jgi:hypothetical protein